MATFLVTIAKLYLINTQHITYIMANAPRPLNAPGAMLLILLWLRVLGSYERHRVRANMNPYKVVRLARPVKMPSSSTVRPEYCMDLACIKKGHQNNRWQ
jgi:hypothetical protein